MQQTNSRTRKRFSEIIKTCFGGPTPFTSSKKEKALNLWRKGVERLLADPDYGGARRLNPLKGFIGLHRMRQSVEISFELTGLPSEIDLLEIYVKQNGTTRLCFARRLYDAHKYEIKEQVFTHLFDLISPDQMKQVVQTLLGEKPQDMKKVDNF